MLRRGNAAEGVLCRTELALLIACTSNECHMMHDDSIYISHSRSSSVEHVQPRANILGVVLKAHSPRIGSFGTLAPHTRT
jgi:hypothetical protein